MSTLASVFGYGLLSARAAAAVAGRFYYATDTGLMYRDNGATWDTLSLPTNSVATDTIWDAAGDLAVGTGADAAGKLTKGAAGTVPTAGASTLAYAYPPGYEFDYAQITSPVTIASTTEGTETAIIDGASVTYDGATKVLIEAQILASFTPGAAARSFVPVFYEDSTTLGRVGILTPIFVSGQSMTVELRLALARTPSAGAHTYHLKGWKTNAGDTASVQAGSGGAGVSNPSYLRVTKI